MPPEKLTLEQLDELAELLGARPRIDHEGGWYYLHWGNDEGVIFFRLEGDAVVVPFIQSPRRGVLASMTWTFIPFMRDLGFKTFVTAAGEPREKAFRWLMGIGFEREREDGMLEGSIEDGCRFYEYARWKQGGNEPDWHKEVVARYGPGA